MKDKKYCCEECFNDQDTKSIIRSKKKIGCCDFCGSENVHLYNLADEIDKTLNQRFNSILEAYSTEKDLGKRLNTMKMFGEILREDWDLFNFNKLEPKSAIEIMKIACDDELVYKLSDKVGIESLDNEDYIKEHSIFSSKSWSDFTSEIKEQYRFHGQIFNPKIFKKYLIFIEKDLEKGEILYRARISRDGRAMKEDEMGIPPSDKVMDGRINPRGIPVLYLSRTEQTPVYEVRAAIYDTVAIGTFKIKKMTKIIDLTSLDSVSPFSGFESDRLEVAEYVLNRKLLQEIAQAISEPVKNENILDYLPTQYICELIKSAGYDGIEYKSALEENARNIVLFSADNVECIDVKMKTVATIEYRMDE